MKVDQDGSVPSTFSAASGIPLVVTANDAAPAPTVNVVVPALEKEGEVPTVSVAAVVATGVAVAALLNRARYWLPSCVSAAAKVYVVAVAPGTLVNVAPSSVRSRSSTCH